MNSQTGALKQMKAQLSKEKAESRKLLKVIKKKNI